MTDTISKEMQDAYWEEWQQTQDHWLALAAALKVDPQGSKREALVQANLIKHLADNITDQNYADKRLYILQSAERLIASLEPAGAKE